MQPCLYSPPRDAYILQDISTCAVSTTYKINRGDTIWNLMWLSYPMLDNLPGVGPDWHLVYKTEPGLFPAIVTDVSLYDTLHEMLHEHPPSSLRGLPRRITVRGPLSALAVPNGLPQ
ncbi:MAG: hypothetical protein HT580_13980 [Dechloromonas sp.]|nr:MAG: hypothetical protein HT580_13980 [Dechloromonas sp.]